MKKHIPKDKWIWMPHPGHFVAASSCQFHLSTKVGKWIVSTVGEYFPERIVREIHASVRDKDWFDKNKHLKGDHFDKEFFKKFGFIEIGVDRTYETMVFASKNSTKEKDACESCRYVIDVEKSHPYDETFGQYNDGKSAYRGHMKICTIVSKNQ